MLSPISSAASTPASGQRPSPEEAFRRIDSTGKGYITEADLASAIVTISPEGKSLSQADAAAQAQDAFRKMDANNDGKVTRTEFVAAAQSRPPAGAAPPAGGGGARPGGGSASGSDASLAYELADSNRDGTVSLLEQQVYFVQHASAGAAAADASASAATTS